jgi:NitT/TauT family transport system substrate-binding protein
MEQNPKTTEVVLAAIAEATELIKREPRRMAEVYVKAENSSLDPALIEGIIKDPDNVFTMTPQNVMKFVDFMAETGIVKQRPRGWQELFTPLIRDKPGS